MKNILLFIFLWFYFLSTLQAQNCVSFSEHSLTYKTQDATSVFAVDVDGDGDMDVLSASAWNAKIAWYENDGNQNFTHHTITTAANGANSVYATDVDGDGDMDVLSASYADDKIAWHEITINNSYTGTDTQTACDSYTWIDGNTYTSNNNSATHTLTNVAGCDSVVTLNLTINNSNTGTDIQTTCDSYSWIDGNTYTTSNTTATHTLTNSTGCDSVITLNLTINSVDTGITNSSPTLTATATSATYQWLDCDNNYSLIAGETNQSFTATSSGNYAVEVTQNNCTDTSDCQTVTIIGLQENKTNAIHIYPNPTTGILTIEGVEGIVTVYDIYGRLVLTANSNTVNISHAAMGIYFVRVLDEQGKVYIGKVVKE